MARWELHELPAVKGRVKEIQNINFSTVEGVEKSDFFISRIAQP